MKILKTEINKQMEKKKKKGVKTCREKKNKRVKKSSTRTTGIAKITIRSVSVYFFPWLYFFLFSNA